MAKVCEFSGRKAQAGRWTRHPHSGAWAHRAPQKARRFQVNLQSVTIQTPSGKIEILNPVENEPLPCYLPTHEEFAGGTLRLMTAPSLHSLNASFYERDDLRERQKRMTLLMNPEDAGARGLVDCAAVTAWNTLGEVDFWLEVTAKVPAGVAVAEGVWWIEFAPGERTVNALVSQRLTDQGNGSTFYDNRIEVRQR